MLRIRFRPAGILAYLRHNETEFHEKRGRRNRHHPLQLREGNFGMQRDLLPFQRTETDPRFSRRGARFRLERNLCSLRTYNVFQDR